MKDYIVKFQAKVSRFGPGKAVIIIPKAVLPEVMPYMGKTVIVTLEVSAW